MPVGDVGARYRLFASHCLAIAQDTTDPARKLALLDMAQAWMALAEQTEAHARASERASQPPKRDGD